MKGLFPVESRLLLIIISSSLSSPSLTSSSIGAPSLLPLNESITFCREIFLLMVLCPAVVEDAVEEVEVVALALSSSITERRSKSGGGRWISR